MFKKLLAVLFLSTFLACTTGVPAQVQNVRVVSPHVEKLNELNTDFNIIDYREDEDTLWMWIDNKNMPDGCDYVVITRKVEDIDPTTGLPGLLLIMVVNPEQYPNPCDTGYSIYEEYVKERNKLKGGI